MLDLPCLEFLSLDEIDDPSEFTVIVPVVSHSLRELHYISAYCDGTVLPAIAALTRLHTLVLSYTDYSGLAMLFGGLNAAPTFLLPELHVLELGFFEFSWDRASDESWTDKDESSNIAARAILDFVRARNSTAERDAAAADGRKPPAKIDRVRFVDCWLSDRYCEELQALVCVDWCALFFPKAVIVDHCGRW